MASTALGRNLYIAGTITLSDLRRIIPLPKPLAPPPPAVLAPSTTESTAEFSPTTLVSTPAIDSASSSSKSRSTSGPSSAQHPSVDTNLTPGEEWPKDTNVGSPEFYSSDNSNSSYQPSKRSASEDIDNIITDSDHYPELPPDDVMPDVMPDTSNVPPTSSIAIPHASQHSQHQTMFHHRRLPLKFQRLKILSTSFTQSPTTSSCTLSTLILVIKFSSMPFNVSSRTLIMIGPLVWSFINHLPDHIKITSLHPVKLPLPL